MTPRTSKARKALIDEMTEVFRAYQRSVDALDEKAGELMGVNRTDGRVLDLIEQHGRMTAGEIASGAGLTSGAVTGVIDRLERMGYATRVRDDTDRRKVLVEPTAKMREQAQRIYYPMGLKGEKVMKRYSDEDLRLVIDFLRAATGITEERTAELRDEAG